MATILLTPEIILHGLTVPPGKTRVEYCDLHPESRGLYIEVTARKPNHGIYRVRTKVDGRSTHFVIGKTDSVTLQSAREKTVLLKNQLAMGINPKADATPKKEDLNLHDFYYDHFDPFCSRLRSNARYQELFKLRIDAAFGQHKLHQIKRHDVINFLAALKASGLAAASVNHHAKLLRRALNLAVDWEMLDRNPLSRIPMYSEEDGKKERYMNDVELTRFLKALDADPDSVPALLFRWLLSTGARYSEGAKCTYDQLDLASRTWRLPSSNSKSKKIRAIPVNDAALDVLKRLEPNRGQSKFVFANRKTGLPYVSPAKAFSKIKLLSDLPHLRIHDLRHQYASFLVNAGRTLFEVQQILGHSDPSVTQRYSHLSTKSLSDAANSASIAIKRGMQVAAA